MLWVVLTDFQRNLAEFDCTTSGAEGPVRQVEWCGNDAILVTWDALVLLVGPFGDTLQCVQLQIKPYILTRDIGTTMLGPRLLSLR